MTPTVTQQLEAMRDTMQTVVLPALPAEARFAMEQAGLTLASLSWMIDVNESQTAYELVEQADLHALGEGLLGLGLDEVAGADVAGLKADLAARPEATAALSSLREHNRALKARTAAVLEAAPAESSAQVMALFATAARRQVAREQAYCRMTGMAKQSTGSIEDVLLEQARG